MKRVIFHPISNNFDDLFFEAFFESILSYERRKIEKGGWYVITNNIEIYRRKIFDQQRKCCVRICREQRHATAENVVKLRAKIEVQGTRRKQKPIRILPLYETPIDKNKKLIWYTYVHIVIIPIEKYKSNATCAPVCLKYRTDRLIFDKRQKFEKKIFLT